MDIYERIKQILSSRNDIIVFEFGACDGSDILAITDRMAGKRYKYYAFEASAIRIPQMKSHGHVRSVPNLTVINKAIGAIDGRTPFYISSENYYGSSSIRKPTEELFKSFPEMLFTIGEVVVVKLDTYCRQNKIKHIDFIWSDVQGAEGDMIAGGTEMLRHTDYLYPEYNNGPAYEGCLALPGILDLLPGWTLIEDYGGDALLRNDEVS